MDPDFNHLRPRGYQSLQFRPAMTSHFQPSHRPTYFAFSSPGPITPGDPIPITHDANEFYQQVPHHSGFQFDWNGNAAHYAPPSQHPQFPQFRNYDPSSSVPPTMDSKYQLQDGPEYEPTPPYSWQSPPSPHEEKEDHEGPPREYPNQEPRGRKRHERSHSTRARSEERLGSEPHRSLEPWKPKRGFLRAASRLRQNRPLSGGFIRSPKKTSRNILVSPRRPVQSRKLDLEKYRYIDHDRSGTARPQERQEHRPVSTPVIPPVAATGYRPISQRDAQKLSHASRQASPSTCPKTPHRSHRAESRDHSAQLVSLTQTSPTHNTMGDHPYSRSGLGHFDENLEIPRMNGLLDIWDSTENPNWEEETFALCDLEHCRRCGKYFVVMRTIGHKCRN